MVTYPLTTPTAPRTQDALSQNGAYQIYGHLSQEQVMLMDLEYPSFRHTTRDGWSTGRWLPKFTQSVFVPKYLWFFAVHHNNR